MDGTGVAQLAVESREAASAVVGIDSGEPLVSRHICVGPDFQTDSVMALELHVWGIWMLQHQIVYGVIVEDLCVLCLGIREWQYDTIVHTIDGWQAEGGRRVVFDADEKEFQRTVFLFVIRALPIVCLTRLVIGKNGCHSE